MFRWITRLMLIVYFVLPIAAIVLVVTTIQQVQADVEPVITNAATTINTATAALDTEIRNMSANFQPIVSAVNALRNGLRAVNSFISGAINVMVDAVNKLTFNTLDIPRFRGISIPPLVDLGFISRISQNLTNISGQVTTVATTVTTTVTARLQILLLAIVLLVVWMVLGFVLMWLTMFLTLWRGAKAQ